MPVNVCPARGGPGCSYTPGRLGVPAEFTLLVADSRVSAARTTQDPPLTLSDSACPRYCHAIVTPVSPQSSLQFGSHTSRDCPADDLGSLHAQVIRLSGRRPLGTRM